MRCYVMRVRSSSASTPSCTSWRSAAAASLAEAQLLGRGARRSTSIRSRSASRSIGQAIVAEAALRGADLIVLGSSPRWRRQSAFFSPTVDYVLRNAPCEVLVVAFPQGCSRARLLRMKLVVIGCGRVGSAVARDFQATAGT